MFPKVTISVAWIVLLLLITAFSLGMVVACVFKLGTWQLIEPVPAWSLEIPVPKASSMEMFKYP